MDAMIFRTLSLRSKRRAGWLLLVLSGWIGTRGCRADDPTPHALPASKYARMAAHSPFAPPTAPVTTAAAPTPPPVPGWADNLMVTMIMQDGVKYMVTVVDTTNLQQHLYLTSGPEKPNEMAVASVKWGATREEAPIITLRKGKEFAQVRYEAGSGAPGGGTTLGSGGPPIPGGVRNVGVGMPGAQGVHPPPLMNGVAGNPGGMPGNALRRPVIHSQPGPAAAPAPVRPGVNQPVAGIRPKPGVQADDDDDDD